MRRIDLLSLAFVLSLLQGACVVSAEPGGEDVREHGQPVVIVNGLGSNALRPNGVTFNGLTSDVTVSRALLRSPLTSGSIASNPQVIEALGSSIARDVFAYIASCALEHGDVLGVDVDGARYLYDGELGLAPQWGKPGGACDDRCQSLISACLLARVNFLGESVIISLRGILPALATTRAERSEFRHREAAYYGNVFAPSPSYYACLSPGETTIPRVCGDSPRESCFLTIAGDCDEVCAHPHPDGGYWRCSDPSGDAHPAITVFLR